MTATATRKGAGRVADVPPEVLRALENGTVETRTLAEGLAIDFGRLLRAVAPDLPETKAALLDALAGAGVTRRMASAAAILLDHWGPDAVARLAGHRSDTVRGWAAYALAALPDENLARRLDCVRPLADDPHFGVREWAWLAVRPHLAADPEASIALLRPWTASGAANLRRFAVEALRPRGVWSTHIGLFKERPEAGLPLLEPLRADHERYVQDSVANWLNDAAKSRPDWVRALCRRWRAESPGAATERICLRAQRSL